MGEVFKHVLKQRQQKKAAELKVQTAARINAERAAEREALEAKRRAERRAIEEQRRAEKKADEQRRRAERQAAEKRRQQEKALADAAAAERARRSAPRTKYVAATNPRAVTIWHWKVAPSPVPLKDAPSGVGPAAYLPPGGGMHTAPDWLVKKRPALKSDDDFRAWRSGNEAVIAAFTKRYSGLKHIRDERWWRRLCESADITLSQTTTKMWKGKYGSGARNVTKISVPVLKAARVAPDGLRLRIAGRLGDSSKRWNAKIDTLRSGFKAAGLDARELAITEASNGDIVLAFHDADPFADVPTGVTPYDSDKGRSLLGVTSRGEQAFITWAGSSGMVVGGVPGSGKTASLLPVFAGMAGQAELHVFDGKSGFDLHPLRHIARTYDRTGDLDAPLETLEAMEELRAERAEALYQKLHANNFWNLSTKQREQLGVTPVFVILDECQTWLDTSGMDKDEKATASRITKLVRTLVQKGRSAGIVVVLTTQKPDSITIPTVIRDNAALKLCFRVSTPEQATTVLGGQAQNAPDPTKIPMPAKGRFVMETEGRGIVLGQAAYVKPDELDEMLKEHKPVPDQAGVAAGLLGRAVEPDEEEEEETDMEAVEGQQDTPSGTAETDVDVDTTANTAADVDTTTDTEADTGADADADAAVDTDAEAPAPADKAEAKAKAKAKPRPKHKIVKRRAVAVGSDDNW